MTKMKVDELPCPKCKEPIKAAASKCKHCGNEMSSSEVSSRVKENQNSQAIGAGCVLLLFIVGFFTFCTGGSEDDTTADVAQAAIDQEKGFHCLSAWDGSHPDFEARVKANLRDPDSYEHEETRVGPKSAEGTHTIFMKYRAKNGFGGMNLETAVGSFDNVTCAASDPIM